MCLLMSVHKCMYVCMCVCVSVCCLGLLHGHAVAEVVDLQSVKCHIIIIIVIICVVVIAQ